MTTLLRSIKIIYFLLVIAYSLFPTISYADNPYSNCIFSWEYGDINRKVIAVSPVGTNCAQICNNECKAFSRIGYGGELNQDVIDNCLMSCQQGGYKFTSSYREPNPDSSAWMPYIVKDPVTIGANCTTTLTSPDSATYNYYPVGVEVNSDAKAYFTILNTGNATSNTIYMCGIKTLTMYPSIYSFNYDTWNNNRNLWSARNTSPTTWNARNPNWTDTNIDVKNGDYLSITTSWGDGTQCPDHNCTGLPLQYSLGIRAPYMQNWNDGDQLTLWGDELQVAGDNGSGGYTLSPQQASANNVKYVFYGLKNSVFKDVRSNVNVDGRFRDYYFFKTITYQGYLKGFSDRWTRLGLRHYDTDDWSNWEDNIGGQYVQISWKGCPFFNGDRLQYALVPPDPNDVVNTYKPWEANVEWHDISQSDITAGKPVQLKGPKRGAVYLRIKPLPYETNKAPICPNGESICQSSNYAVNNNYAPWKGTGYYFVQVEIEGDPPSITGFVSDMINTVKGYLLGDSSQPGKVQTIFNRMVTNSSLIDAIRALLVLYIAYTGLSFIAGFAQITQQDALIRLFKIAIILILISPSSWKFFNTYLFTLFTEGGLTLIAKVVIASTATSDQIANIERDPSLIFSVFDQPFFQLFSKEVWIKILAVLMSSMLGIILAIIIALSAIIYIFCIAKAIFIYLMSLIVIAIILMLAPIFISFILFQYTRQYFDAWIKVLISYTLQPIFVFGIIGMINYLLLAALHVVLAFNACKICLIGFNFSPLDIDFCLIPGWVTLVSMHYPVSGFISSPINQIGAVLFFFLMTQSTYVLTDYITQIAQTLVSGAYFGTNLAELVNSANPVSKGLEGLGEVTGTSQKLQTTREGLLKPIKEGYQKGKQSQNNQRPRT